MVKKPPLFVPIHWKGRKLKIFRIIADKDYGEMFRPVMPYAEKFVCITPDNPRKLPAGELAAYLRQAGADAQGFDTVAQGVRYAMDLAGRDGVVLCFGSLYSIADIRAGLEEVLQDI